MDSENVKGSMRNQAIAVFTINIITFNQGCAIAWVSPALPLLTSEDSPLGSPLSSALAGLVASAFCIGAIFGTLLYGWLSDKIGRKKAALTTALPFLGCWGLKLLLRNPYILICARLLAGFGGAGMLLVAPIYSAEVASVENRGILGMALTLTFNTGIIFAYVIGAYFSYSTILIVLMSFPLIFLGLMVQMPESPSFLARNNMYEEAAEAIAWLRSVPVKSRLVKEEVENLRQEMKMVDGGDDSTIKRKPEKNTPAWRILVKSPPSLKTMVVIASLLTAQTFMGMFAVLSYASDIFREAGSSLSPDASSIVVGVLQLFGAVVAATFIERLGRKILLVGSALAVIICMTVLGTYFYLRDSGHDVSRFGWLPVTALSLAVCTYAMGIGPIPFILPSEMLMMQVRGLVTSIGLTWLWVSTFFLAQFFSAAVAFLGNHIVFWGFAFVGCVAVFICVVFLPETKGRPIEDIVAHFGGRKEQLMTHLEDGELLNKDGQDSKQDHRL